MKRCILMLAAFLCVSFAVDGADLLPPGHRPKSPGTHALVGGTVVTKPGERLANGVVLIRDGKIQEVGVGIAVPNGYRVWDMQGTWIYPGFIDAHLTQKAKSVLEAPGTDSHDHDATSGGGPNFFGIPGQEMDAGNPGAGYGIKVVTPEHRVAEAYSPDKEETRKLHDIGFTAGTIVPEKGIFRGSSAFVLLSDSSPNDAILKPDVFQHVTFDTATGANTYPGSLMGMLAVVRQTFLDAAHYHDSRRAAAQANSSQERMPLNLALEALGSVIARTAPAVFEAKSILMVSRAAKIADELQLNLVLLSTGQEWRRPDIIGDVDAPFIVPLTFAEAPKLPDADDWEVVTLDQLRAWDWAPENAALLRQMGKEIALTTYGLGDRKTFRKNLRLALDRGLSEDDALAALTTIPAKLCGVEQSLGAIEKGRIANLTVVEHGSYFVVTNKVRELWISGEVYRIEAGSKAEQAQTQQEIKPSTDVAQADKEEKAREQEKEKQKREAQLKRIAKSPMENRGAFAEPKTVLVRNATIWTSGPQGTIAKGDFLVENGKVAKVGTALPMVDGAHVIDGDGKHVSPGLIDCHSHSFILGAVNEGTLPSSAMVRVADVINSETRRITDELAGGLTAANVLHGSANPIGGQNVVVKLRAGATPDQMIMEGAPSGIKFALGENVKQSNRTSPTLTRFPQSRMGVPTFMRNRFVAAQQYAKQWEAHRANPGSVAPRRDLELEALSEIIRGERLIHCHCYRQDEIVAFLKLMEEFKVRVATLQHVLEGYKIADEIAKHGAGASAFSDWWGYKYEAIDAVPYAGALMHERGVLVSFNSDSGDLARRLYLEAAKAVKYGNVAEVDALKFVTINPAKQLGIDQRVGSLEPGKDADFVIWSGSPLDSKTICLETWVDGKKYFDRSLAAARVAELGKEREALLVKAKRVAGLTKDEAPSASSAAPKMAFFVPPLELWFENEYRHCDAE